MSFVLRRNEGETWKQAALRVAREFGVEAEVEESYEEARARGVEEQQAAWEACYEWDVLELAP